MTEKGSFGKIKGWHNPLEDNAFWEIRSGLNQVPPILLPPGARCRSFWYQYDVEGSSLENEIRL